MNLTEDDIERCQKAFSDLDDMGDGEIKDSDLEQALNLVGIYNISQDQIFKMISELDEQNTGRIKFQAFLNLYAQINNKNSQDDDQDMIDAFVAMGGDEDLGGEVNAQKLIDIIKNEFEMTIDIEKLIERIDSDKSGKIEFNEFKALLQSSNIQDDQN